MQKYDEAFFMKTKQYIMNRLPDVPEIGMILGSALGPFADQIQDPITIDYQDIPNFLISTAPGHAGKLIYGTISGKKVLCMSGRFHYYEGYDFDQLVIPVRMFKLIGVKALILTNAAGAVNLDYKPGDIMVVNDHIKLHGDSPLRGANLEMFGPRFFDVTKMYTPELREIALACAKDTKLNVHEGVYMYFGGPQFETSAEIRAARLLGADAVGMSTVTEALTAAHCGLPVLCLSVMTNMAAGILDQPLSGEEVDAVGRMIANDFSDYVKKVVGAL